MSFGDGEDTGEAEGGIEDDIGRGTGVGLEIDDGATGVGFEIDDGVVGGAGDVPNEGFPDKGIGFAPAGGVEDTGAGDEGIPRSG